MTQSWYMIQEVITTMTITGAPRTKKNSPRIAKTRSGRRFVLPSKAFEEYQKSALWQLKKLWRERPLQCPVAVEAHFYRDRDVGDLDNYEHALGDILERGKVLVNDKQIKSWDGSRLHKSKANPRVHITIRTFSVVPTPE